MLSRSVWLFGTITFIASMATVMFNIALYQKRPVVAPAPVLYVGQKMEWMRASGKVDQRELLVGTINQLELPVGRFDQQQLSVGTASKEKSQTRTGNWQKHVGKQESLIHSLPVAEQVTETSTASLRTKTKDGLHGRKISVLQGDNSGTSRLVLDTSSSHLKSQEATGTLSNRVTTLHLEAAVPTRPALEVKKRISSSSIQIKVASHEPTYTLKRTSQSPIVTSEASIIYHTQQVPEKLQTLERIKIKTYLSLELPSVADGGQPASSLTPATILTADTHLDTQSSSTDPTTLPVSIKAVTSSIQKPLVSAVGSHGYVLAVNYYEQQTMGLRNMFQLQCWAQHLNLLVVKPVLHDSFLRTPLNAQQQAKFLRFEDSFNLTEWNLLSDHHQYAPLIEWNKFLSRAPRNIIIAQFEHPAVSLLKIRQKSGQKLLHSPDPQQFGTGCSLKWPTSSEIHFLQSKGFRVVHTACFNFYFGDQLSLDAFNEHLLGGHQPNSVSIIMEMWRGISSAQRVLLKDVCRNAIIQEHISLSPTLQRKAKQYTQKYLRGKPYLAIMGRLEISQLTVHKKVPVVPFCLEETLESWKEFKAETQLDETFLAIDIGRYGSKGFRSNLDPTLKTALQKFFEGLYGSSLTMKVWESRFEAVAGCKDAGYIALLQKVLVTHAKCILFVGGGAFQRHALFLYKQLHPNPRDQCYRVVKKCTRSGKLE